MGIGDLVLAVAFLFLIFDGPTWVASKVTHTAEGNPPNPS